MCVGADRAAPGRGTGREHCGDGPGASAVPCIQEDQHQPDGRQLERKEHDPRHTGIYG
jgi:hypothetical protein